MADLGARLNQILAGKDKARAVPLARAVGDQPLRGRRSCPRSRTTWSPIDRAMEWGYGWGLGPFRLLDALGVAAVAERARAEGRAIPPLIEQLLASGRKRFYESEDGARDDLRARPASRRCRTRPGVIDVAALKARGGAEEEERGRQPGRPRRRRGPRRVPLAR